MRLPESPIHLCRQEAEEFSGQLSQTAGKKAWGEGGNHRTGHHPKPKS